MNETQEFLLAVERELNSAREKYPCADVNIVKLMEEVGELAKALLEESQSRIHAEAVQVAAMACRVATETDALMNSYRTKNHIS